MFIYILGKFWRNAYNRRKFFIEFASQKGFDPLVPEHWEKIQKREMIKQVKGVEEREMERRR